MPTDLKTYDLAVTSTESIETEEGLRTAILLSLLTRARARPDDVIPDPADRGGWWGDTYSEVPNDSFGSRIWTLAGRPINAALMSDLELMIREALQWLIDDGYIGAVGVELEVIKHGTIGAKIEVSRPTTSAIAADVRWEFTI
jgi:phage gp46-like protein